MANFDYKGKEYRVKENGLWKIYSFLTHASDVLFDDNKNLVDKISELFTTKSNKTDIIDDLSTAVAVTQSQTPLGCGVAKELNQEMLHIVSFDVSTGTLVTKSYDYTG